MIAIACLVSYDCRADKDKCGGPSCVCMYTRVYVSSGLLREGDAGGELGGHSKGRNGI